MVTKKNTSQENPNDPGEVAVVAPAQEEPVSTGDPGLPEEVSHRGDQPRPSTGRRRLNWRSAVPVAVALSLFGAGTATGYVFGLSNDLEETTPTTIPSETTTGSIIEVGDEPYVRVAEAIRPSIVMIGTQMGVGSGVVYDADEGLILTAAHVVSDVTVGGPGSVVQAQLSDGRLVEVGIVGLDVDNDVAVLQIEVEGLVAAPLALGEEPRVGQRVVAVGSPWGLESTVTAGIVSAYRALVSPDEKYRTVIQTDAPINPGNSGGPLVDMNGRVLGINVSIYSGSGASDGVGFAVPITRAHRIAQKLVSGETYVPGYLGVKGGYNQVGEAAGAKIAEVLAGSAAEDAGIRPGDFIIAVDGVPIGGLPELAATFQDREAGDTVVLTIRRGESTLEKTVILGVQTDDA